MTAKRAHRAGGFTSLLILPLVLAASACEGPPVPSTVTGEPVCPDFEVGATREKMQGGLMFPVQITIKEGKSVQARALVLGLRSASDPATRIVLPDANAEYSVEWAQCENERAPRPVSWSPKSRADKGASGYECGTAAPYKNETLVTRKHAVATHAVTFAPPPKPGCWSTEAPAADAGAPAALPASSALPDGSAPPLP